MNISPNDLLKKMYFSAVDQAAPLKIINNFLPEEPKTQKVYVIGAGKAAASMAFALESFWKKADISGLVITRYGHSVDCQKIKVIEASHPVPDNSGHEAAKEILNIVKNANENDLIIGLISGGGSSLLTYPAKEVSLEEKQKITKQLLKSGADISDINCVRKHLSSIKGGRLAELSKAPMINLIISDVTGDDLSVIASGPTVPDKTTCKDALKIIDDNEIEISEELRNLLKTNALETPKPNNSCFDNIKNKIIASPFKSLKTAAKVAKQYDIPVLNLGDYIEGEAKDVAKVLAGIALSCKVNNTPIKPPCIIISGGETSVTVSGKGRGGRNGEFLLSFGNNICKHPDLSKYIYALACDTDGIDGSEDNAGAMWTPKMSAKVIEDKSFLEKCLSENDSYGFFKKENSLIITKPTLTNVNDFRAIYIADN